MLLFLLGSLNVWATVTSGTFAKITSTDNLTTGYYIIAASESASSNAGYAAGNSVNLDGRLTGVSVTISSGTTISNPDDALVYLITKTTTNNVDSYTFLNVKENKYLYQASTTSGKGMGLQTSSANFTLAGYNSESPIGFRFTLDGNSTNYFKYNASSKWFANYANAYSVSMTPVRLFKAYKVTYDGNGKTGGNVPTDAVYYTGAGTAVVTVKANSGSLVKEGYTFVGWNTKANGTGDTYEAGTGQFTITANTTLYAKWVPSGCSSSVTVEKGEESHGTFTLDQSGSILSCDGVSVIVTPSAAEHYHVGSVSASTSEEGVDNGDGTWTITYAENTTGTSTINVEFVEDTKYTLNYHDGSGNDSKTNIYEGTNLITALGTPAASCDETSTIFSGWTTSEIATKTSTAPTFVASNAVVNATTATQKYWAVYAKNGTEASVTGGNFSDDIVSGWSKSGTGTYSGNGVKFDSENDYIQSSDISSNNYKAVTVKLKAGHNGGSGSVLTIAALDNSGNVIDSKTLTPTEAYTSQSTTYSINLSGSITIKYVRVTMTYKANNLGMKYCEVFVTPKSDYMTTCCNALGTIDGTIALTNEGCVETQLKATWKMAATTGIASQVLHVYKSSDDSEIEGSKITGITASTENQTKTIEGLQAGTSYYVKVENISEGGDFCADGFAGTSEAASTHNVYNLLVQDDNSGKGTIALRDATDENDATNNAPYMAGTVLTIKAIVTDPTTDQFVNWTVEPANAVTFDNANVATTTITIGTQAATITANFQEIPSTTYTVTFNQGTLGTLDCNACSESALEEASAGAGVTLPACVPSADNYTFLGWTATPSGTTVDDGANAGDVYHPTSNMTLYAVYKQLKTVTLMKRDDSGTDVVLYENPATGKVELPTRTCKNSNYSFAGWSTKYYENEQEGADVVIQPVGEYEPTADVTLYPVFKRGEEAVIWTRTAVADVTAGVYAIITPDGKAFNGTVNSSGHGESTENAFSFTNGVATSAPTGTCELTIAAVTNGYTMYNASHGYLYAKAASSGNLDWHATESRYWKAYQGNWEYCGNNGSNYYAYLRTNNSQFRTYGNNTGDVLEFAKKEEQHAYYVAAPANLVLAPTFTPVEGTYYGTQSVTLNCATENTTIYYTIGDDPADPDNNSTEYTEAISVSASQKIKTIAYDNEGFHSEVATAEYTIYPEYTTIADFVNADPAPAKAKLTFTAESNAVVLGKTNNNIYLQDNTGSLLLFKSGHGKTWATGKKVVGSIIGNYSLYNEMPEMVVTEFVDGIDATEDGVMPTPVTITEINSEIFAANACKLVKMEGVNFQNTSLSSNAVTINKGETPYTVFNTFSVLNQPLPLLTTSCDVVGVLNSTKVNDDVTYRIAPISVDGISTNGASAVLPSISDAGGADEASAVEVAQGKNITMTKAENFDAIYQLNDGDETAIETNTAIEITETASATKLYVKASRYYYTPVELTYYYIANASLAEHTITCATGLEGGSVNAGGVASALPNVQISLTAVPADHYTFGAWDVYETGNETNKVTVENNQFSMPEYNVTVSATFVEDAHAIVEYIGGTGATGAAAVPSEKVYLGEGAHATMPAKGTLALTGNTFAGWQLNGEGAVLAVGDTYEVNTAGTLTFKAAWTPYPWTGNGKWELVTDANSLAADDYLVIASPAHNVVAAQALNNNQRLEDVTAAFNSDGTLLTDMGEDAVVLTLGGTAGAWTFTNPNDVQLTSTAEKTVKWDNTAGTRTWTVAIDANNEYKATITNGTTTYGKLMYNAQATYFSTYTSTPSVNMVLPKLYRFVAGSFFNVEYADGKLDPGDEVTNMPTTQVTESDGTTTLSDKVPVYVGYTFLNWSDGVNTYDPSDPIGPLSANTTLTAQWETATEHPLSYEKNGGEGDVPAVTSYYPNAQVTLAAALTKDGLLFAGWEDENGMVYAAGSSFTMPNTDVVLTAKFVTGAVYTVATRTSVTASGEPEGSTATFNNTANTGTFTQITGGNSMTLTLTDYDLYTIKGLTLSMRSNGSSGAGTLSFTIGGSPVSFTTNKWYNGSYNYGTFEDIQVSFDPIRVMPDEEIVITIAATASSLYCQSFTLEYERVLDEIRSAGVEPGVMGTICPRQEVKYPTGASFYTVSYKEEVAGEPYKVFFDEIAEGASLQAGVPYLFIADEGSNAIKGIKVGDEAADGLKVKGLQGVLNSDPGYVDITVDADDVTNYKYYIIYNNQIRLCGEGAFRIRDERAYLIMNDPSLGTTPVANMPGRRRVALGVQGKNTATGLENGELMNDAMVKKVLINGELFILRGKKMYDAQGHLVK